MTRMRPIDKLKAWKSEIAIDRVLGCAAMLHCHGFLSDAERNRVQSRIEKWLTKHGVKHEVRRI